MDRSVGTIDAHKLKFSSHLNNISDDSLDDEDDDERSKELDGLLQNAFDDMSSIGDDEDPLDNDMRHSKHTPSSHRQHSPMLYSNQHNGNLIPSPQPTPSENDSGTGKSETGLHLRLLLEENEKVSKLNEELKSQLKQRDDQLTQLTARNQTLEVNTQSLHEAKSQLSKELELAKATIRTFESQIEDMAKSEFLEDERSYYNRIIGEKEAKFRDERLEWIEKVRNLTEVLDTKDNQIERLNAKISNFDESTMIEERRRLSDEISRLQKQLTDKEDEIRRLSSLTRNMSLRIKNLERSNPNSGHNSPCTEVHDCSPHPITSEHRLSPHRPVLSCQSPSSSSEHNQRRELASECQSTGKIFISPTELHNLKASNEKWRQETEQKYLNHFFAQVEDLKKKYVIERDSWQSVLKKDVQLLATWIETLSLDQSSNASTKQCKLLAPLRDLWLVVETKFEERRKALLDKKHEIEEAMRDLEDAYNKSLEHENSYSPTSIDELKDKLTETQEEVEMLKAKYQRYKRNYLKLRENTIRERDELKQQFAQMLHEAKSRGDGHN